VADQSAQVAGSRRFVLAGWVGKGHSGPEGLNSARRPILLVTGFKGAI